MVINQTSFKLGISFSRQSKNIYINALLQIKLGLLLPAVTPGCREKPHGKGVVNAVLPVELRTPEHKEITMGSKHQELE